IGRGNFHEFREGPIQIDSDNLQVLADVRLSEAALLAMPAIQVHLRADKVAGPHGRYLFAGLLHNPAKLVAKRDGRLDAPLRPAVPPIDMQVRSTDRGGLYPHQYVRRSGRRHVRTLDLQT